MSASGFDRDMGLRYHFAKKKARVPACLKAHHVLPLTRVTVFADKAVKFHLLKEDGLARETDTSEAAFPDPSHDGGAVDVPEMEGGLT
jgi:hypothetical protein